MTITSVPKLKDVTELAVDNDVCAVLRVARTSDMLKLVAMGVFDGNEMLFRVTKEQNPGITIFYADGRTEEWVDGRFTATPSFQRRLQHLDSIPTPITIRQSKIMDIIETCLTQDFGVSIKPKCTNAKQGS